MSSLPEVSRPVFVTGGSGFVGRAVLELCLDRGRCVITTTRARSIEAFISALCAHGFPEHKARSWIAAGRLRVLLGLDLGCPRLRAFSEWEAVFSRVGVRPAQLALIINLATDTSGTSRDILYANIATTSNMIALLERLRSAGQPGPVVITMGSVAEKAWFERSPYSRAKRQARALIDAANAADFHLIACYIKGRGDKKMPAAAPYLLRRLHGFPYWHSGFAVSIVDVDELAALMLLLEERALALKQLCGVPDRAIEVAFTSGELTLADVLSNVVQPPVAADFAARRKLPRGVEVLYLLAFFCWSRLFFNHDQLKMRLATFALLGALRPLPKVQHKINYHLAVGRAEQIKQAALASPQRVIELAPELLCIRESDAARLSILQEHDQQRLRTIVRQAVAAATPF